jgi:hypothetical protein
MQNSLLLYHCGIVGFGRGTGYGCIVTFPGESSLERGFGYGCIVISSGGEGLGRGLGYGCIMTLSGDLGLGRDLGYGCMVMSPGSLTGLSHLLPRLGFGSGLPVMLS